MRTLLFFLFFSTLFLVTPLSARLSLKHCQTLALENGGKKTIADLNALIAFDRIDEARSLCRLQLNAHGDYMTAGDIKNTHKNKRHGHANVALVFPLYDFGMTQESIRSQKKLYDSALSQVEKIEQEILYSIHEAYFTLLIAQKFEWIVLASIDSLRKQLQVTQDFISHGLLHRNEGLVLEVQLAQLNQDLLETCQRTELARVRLNRLMGLELNTPIELEDVLPTLKQAECLEDLITIAKLNHPELAALKKQLEASQHSYRAEQAQLYPKVYAFSTYSTTSDYALPYQHGLDVGIGVDWNLYDGGNTRAKMRRMKTEQCELEVRYEELLKDIELKLRSSFLTIQTTLSKIPVAEKGLYLAEEDLSLTKDLFEEGLVSNIDIIQKEENLSQARLNYYQALFTYHQARASLFYSAGIMYQKGCL